MIDLRGSKALVTGGSRGIGAACCRLLARAGCDIAVHYRERVDEARRLAEEIVAMGRQALTISADISDPQQVRHLVGQAATELNGLNIVVGNAGIWKGAAVAEMTNAEWDEMIGINLSGLFYLSRESIPHLRLAGGSLIFIASTAGQRGEAGHAHYAASKGGVIALTRSLAVELAPAKIRVNAVSPGWIRTDMTEALLRPDRIDESLKEPIPLGRPGEPEDVAGPVVFLASPLARHITGAIINVNGGAVLA
ncbi:MAG: SDR family oxidoreductase [Candidatus Eisenbacteria bacterium]|uniref:SDR family oxidoreductase n=1 Tax=Eiseniibacteriota bacterium TaxID=2212470 RepID=A0A948W502_UNCEI|nr:SDR family oxidoreductase [Candidatus Eisenbacteria bacterium]MBU1950814.1 SDR family oxidoreductase [Candidatus Eisenbacteria bacterium]MBU2692797.1 SDR family oxidoreductase [Candidatus Eisenbacteria bacterium]